MTFPWLSLPVVLEGQIPATLFPVLPSTYGLAAPVHLKNFSRHTNKDQSRQRLQQLVLYSHQHTGQYKHQQYAGE